MKLGGNPPFFMESRIFIYKLTYLIKMKISELRSMIREELIKSLTEGEIEIGAKVKIVSPELADYNKIGEVQDEDPSGKFYMVKLKSGLAYFHESDLRVIK